MAKPNQKDIVKLESNKYRNRLEKEGKIEDWDKFVASNPNVKGGELVKAFNAREVQPVTPPPPIAPTTPTPVVSPYKTSEWGGVTSTTTTAKNISTGLGKVTPAPVGKTTEIAPVETLPFMAQAIDNNKNAYYGTGLQGWARKTFASIWDPEQYTQNIKNVNVKELLPEATEETEKRINEGWLKWDTWGKDLFGISAHDIATVSAAQQGERVSAKLGEKNNLDTGGQGGLGRGAGPGVGGMKGKAITESEAGTKIAQAAGIVPRAVGQEVMTALGLFGALDYMKRKDIMLRQASYEMAQDSDLYQQAQEAGVGEWLLGRGAGTLNEQTTNIANLGFVEENPMVQAFTPNLVISQRIRATFQTASVLLDADTRATALETYKKYWEGSSMAYTMVSDAARRQAFIDAVNNGVEPGLAAQENANMWTEVGGSIINDPLTYMGVGIFGKGKTVKKLGDLRFGVGKLSRFLGVGEKTLVIPLEKIGETPSFGQLIGAGLKYQQTSKAAKASSIALSAAVSDVARLDAIAPLEKTLANVSSDVEAAAELKNVTNRIIGEIDKWGKNLESNAVPNLRTLDSSTSKVSKVTKNIRNALGNLFAIGEETKSVDDVLESLQDLRNMHTGTEAERQAAVLAMRSKLGNNMFLTEDFLQTGKMLSQLQDDKTIARLATKSGGNPAEFLEAITKRIDDITQNFYPSMDKMSQAADDVLKNKAAIDKAQRTIDNLRQQIADAKNLKFGQKVKPKGLGRLEDQLAQAEKTFDADFGRQIAQAEAYNSIPEWQRAARKGLRAFENAAFRPIKKYMDVNYLVLRPAQASRQVQSQAMLLALDMGFVDSAEITAKVTGKMFFEEATNKLLANNAEEIKGLLGFVPEAMMRGVAMSGEAMPAPKFALAWSSRMDTMMSSEITLRVAKKEMAKVMRNAERVFDYGKLRTAFSKDEVNILHNLMLRNGGNSAKTFKEFGEALKIGHFDEWRYTKMTPKLESFLSDTKALGAFEDIQKTALTREEFIQRSDELFDGLANGTRQAIGGDPHVVDKMLPEDVRDMELVAQDLENSGILGKGESNLFNDMSTGFTYMRQELESGMNRFVMVAKEAFKKARALNPNADVIKFNDAINGVDDWIKTSQGVFDPYKKIKDPVLEAIGAGSRLGAKEAAYKIIDAGLEIPGYSAERLASMDIKEIKKVAWPAYFEWQSRYWKESGAPAHDVAMGLLDDLAKSAGTTKEALMVDGELQQFFRAANEYKSGALKAEQELQYVGTDLAGIARRYGISTATEKGKPLNQQLINTLNKNRGELAEFKSWEDANARKDEVRVILERWKAGKTAETVGKAPIAEAGKAMEGAKYGPHTNKEAQDLLAKFDAGEEPKSIVNLIKIANENDIKLSDNDTVVDIVNKIREKSLTKPEMIKLGVNSENRAKDVLELQGNPAFQEAKIKGAKMRMDRLAEDFINKPRENLPPAASERLSMEAQRLKSELLGGEAGGFSKAPQGSDEVGTKFGTTNVEWYRDLYKDTKLQKPEIANALDKIVMDAGKDKGVNVERMKEFILKNFQYGDKGGGVPPDLAVLKEMGAPKLILQEALENFNDIAKTDLTLEEAIAKSAPGVDMAQAVDKTMLYYDELGNLKNATKNVIDNHVPVYTPNTASTAQAVAANYADPAFKAEYMAWRDATVEKWGTQTKTGVYDAAKDAVYNAWKQEASIKMTEVRAKVTKFATVQRDQILLSYDKNLGDLALAYLKPYHYWQTRQSINMLARFVDHPSWANTYVKYKQAMSQEHNDLPDWWKQNIAIQDLPGIHLDNPIYLNLESNLNPIYDLVGTDFNDSKRRPDWISRAVDDLGKVGGSFNPLIQWAVALHLYDKGEADAGSRWMGRFFGQTGTAAKAALNMVGADLNVGKFIQHNELDPFVNFLMGGLDPQERKRVGLAMDQLLTEGRATPEEAAAAMNAQDEDQTGLYAEALLRAGRNRSGTELISYFFGTNFKPRTEQDMRMEKYYGQVGQLIGQKDMMSPEQYRKAWDGLREQNPWVDTVLLAGKNKDDRNLAYTYNVLGRIPPGDSAAVLGSYGIDYAKIQNFYDNKGFGGMSAAEKEQFMGTINQLGATMKLPNNANKREWTDAKNANSEIRKQIEAQFGKEIWGVIDHAYELSGDAQSAWYDSHPEIDEANQMKYEMLVNNPTAFKYYGSMDTIRSYVNGQRYQEIDNRFGEGYKEKVFQYWDMKKDDLDAAKQYFTEEKLGTNYYKFNDFYFGTDEQVNKFVAELAQKLPEGPETVGQSGERINMPREEVLAKIDSEMTPALRNLVKDYFNGKDLSYYAQLQLDKVGDKVGLKQSELLDYLAMMQ